MPLTIITKKQRTLIGQVECVGFPFATPGDWFSADTEGTGLDPWGEYLVDREREPDRPFAFSFCNADGETAYIRWPVCPFTRKVMQDERTYDLLVDLFGNRRTTKVFHNALYDWRMLEKSNIPVKGVIEDTLIAQHAINPDEWEYGLKYLADRYLNISKADEKDLKDSVKKVRSKVQRARQLQLKKGVKLDASNPLAMYMIAEDLEADYWLGDPELCKKYAVTDAYRTALLRNAQYEQMDTGAEEGDHTWETYREELELMRVIRRMEDKGVRVDEERNDEVIQFYRDFLEKASGKVARYSDEDFNPNSNKQKQVIFFGERNYKPLKYVKDKKRKDYTPCQHCEGSGCNICQDTGYNPQCNGDFLEHIGIEKKVDDHGNETLAPKDKLAYWILHHSAAKAMMSFVASYKKLMVKESKGCYVLHPNYKQAGPITDRFSCNTPNLQNVAADDSGKKKSNVPYRPRECFVPRRGKILYLPDYSQIEVWITALRAGDKDLLSALVAGGDTHGRIAHMMWPNDFDFDLAMKSIEELKKVVNALPEQVLKKDDLSNYKTYKKRRKRSKFVQFCKIYGGGAPRIAETVGDGCTVEEAERFSADYDRRFRGVSGYMKRCISFARGNGYIENAFGRRYPVDRNFAYRAANYDVQSSAAVVIKRAMIRIDRMCREEYQGLLDMLLTIHDELMVEGDEGIHSKKLMRKIVTCMQADSEHLGCPVPLPVGMKISRERWASYQEIELS